MYIFISGKIKFLIDLLIDMSELSLPGVVNRTFENRTQSNSIELNPWIEFD